MEMEALAILDLKRRRKHVKRSRVEFLLKNSILPKLEKASECSLIMAINGYCYISPWSRKGFYSVENSVLEASMPNLVIEMVLTAGSQLLNHGVDQTPMCICFLGASQCKEIFQFLLEIPHASG
ncbi:hypothetical protein VNO77_34477 [Canavalia gladiata]|uniref:DUF629 domain-containing protein n=1 Tax=Canavalia gladiata TaxID=3824 RepID=A0AAN9KDN5_CANGL